jgi:hypothetical protein
MSQASDIATVDALDRPRSRSTVSTLASRKPPGRAVTKTARRCGR